LLARAPHNITDPVCKELLHTKGNCLPKINNEKAFTPCGQAAKIIADIVSWVGVQRRSNCGQQPNAGAMLTHTIICPPPLPPCSWTTTMTM
jgi:hypothetical protein